MNTQKTYYEILGIDSSSSEQDIKRAYRQLARDLHPDRGSDSEEAFLELTKAYKTLSSQALRKKYDKLILNAASAQSLLPANFLELGLLKNIRIRFANYLRSFLKDKHEFQISALESIQGSQRELVLEKGANKYRLKIKIPSGINSGQKLRINYPNLEKPILLSIRIRPHPLVERRKNDIIFKIPITQEEANLGAEISVPSPTGLLNVRLPKNWPKNKLFRLAEKGLSLKDGRRADIYIKTEIVKFSRQLLKQKKELFAS